VSASNKDQKTPPAPPNTPMTQEAVSLDSVLLKFQKKFQCDPGKFLQRFPAAEVWRHMVEFPAQVNTDFKKENGTLAEAMELSHMYATTHPEIKNDIAKLRNHFSEMYNKFFSPELKKHYHTAVKGKKSAEELEKIYNDISKTFDAAHKLFVEEVNRYHESKQFVWEYNELTHPDMLCFIIDPHDYQLPLKEFIKKHPHYLVLLLKPLLVATGINLLIENELGPLGDISFNDFVQAQCGWKVFEEDEPGYLKGTLNAYQHWTNLFKTAQPKLSSELIKSIHHAAAQHVKKTNYEKDPTEKSGRFRHITEPALFNEATYYLIYKMNTTNSSLEGFNELIDKINKKKFPILFFLQDPLDETNLTLVENPDENFYNDYANNEYRIIRLIVYIPKGEKIETFLDKKMDEFLSEFEKEISKAKTPRDKLRAIIVFIQDCEQIHFFLDLNCRTLCMNLLNFLLLSHGFPTAILRDPNMLDGFSVDQLIEETIQGMDRALRVAEGEQIFEVPTQKILQCMTDEQKKYFEKAVRIVNPSFNLSKYLSEELTVYSDAKHHVLFTEAEKKSPPSPPPTPPKPFQNN